MKPFLFSLFCYCFFTLLAFSSCKSEEQERQEEDVLLVSVHNKHLYQSELEDMVPAEASSQDSAMIANAFIENWIRESLLMHEAENNIPADLNIDDLVRGYRSSLIRHNYEKLLVELQLDSTITQAQLNAYYEENKAQFKLESPIIQVYYLSLPKEKAPANIAQLWKDFINKSSEELLPFTNLPDTKHLLSDSTWYEVEQVKLLLPKEKRNSVPFRKGTSQQFSTDETLYFLKVLDRLERDNFAPLTFIQDQLRRVILHKRKRELLNQKREEIYEREINRNTIKVYN